MRVLVGIIMLSSIAYANTIQLYFGDLKSCYLEFSQPIDQIESDNPQNIEINVSNNSQVFLSLKHKKTTDLSIFTEGEIKNFKLNYSKSVNDCKFKQDSESAKRNLDLSHVKIISSNQTLSKDKIVFHVSEIKYLGSDVIVEVQIKNHSYQDVDISRVEALTIERYGLFGLAIKPVMFLKNTETNCNYIRSKEYKDCQIKIENFKRRGYALKIRAFNILADEKPIEFIHKFRS